MAKAAPIELELGSDIVHANKSASSCHVLGRRVAVPFRDDTTPSLLLVQSEADFPEPNTAHAAAEWND
jgi:hypothetical protein